MIKVYLPLSPPPTGGYSVMVWIYGGSFVSGAGSLYYGEYLVQEDVMIVTLNYRLGAFGFPHRFLER